MNTGVFGAYQMRKPPQPYSLRRPGPGGSASSAPTGYASRLGSPRATSDVARTATIPIAAVARSMRPDGITEAADTFGRLRPNLRAVLAIAVGAGSAMSGADATATE